MAIFNSFLYVFTIFPQWKHGCFHRCRTEKYYDFLEVGDRQLSGTKLALPMNIKLPSAGTQWMVKYDWTRYDYKVVPPSDVNVGL